MDLIVACREIFLTKKINKALNIFLANNIYKNIILLVDKHGSQTLFWNQILSTIKRKRLHYNVVLVKADTESVEIKQPTDLIISIGQRLVHDVVKRSNKTAIYHCAIETTRSWITSYGTGVMWTNGKAALTTSIPNTIIAFYENKLVWDNNDLVYFFHTVLLSFEAGLNKDANEYVRANSLAGIMLFFKQYRLIQNKKSNKHIGYQLLLADILMKNAYINAPLSPETQKIALMAKNYYEYRRALDHSSRDIIKYHLEFHKDELTDFFNHEKYNLSRFIEDFTNLYNQFVQQKQAEPLTLDIFDKKMLETLSEGQKTRRIG